MDLNDQPLPHPTDEEIALCAYRIWLQEGCPQKRDKEHWLRAREQLIERQVARPPSPAGGFSGST